MRGYSLLALLICALPIFAQDAHTKKTLEFLYSLEQKDGSYLSDTKGKADLRSTSAAMRAIRYLGGKVPHPDLTAKYVASCFDEKAGGFAATPGGKVEIAVTAVGLMASAELKSVKTFAEPATKYLLENAKTFEERRIAVAGLEAIQPYPKNLHELWLDEVFKTRKEDGTFGTVRATGGSAAMLIRARYPLKKEDYEPIRKQLVNGQADDGGYAAPDAKSSDLETTYRVMRALFLLGAKPKEPEKLAKFVKGFANAEGGYGTPPNARDTYYSAIILYWLK